MYVEVCVPCQGDNIRFGNVDDSDTIGHLSVTPFSFRPRTFDIGLEYLADLDYIVLVLCLLTWTFPGFYSETERMFIAIMNLRFEV